MKPKNLLLSAMIVSAVIGWGNIGPVGLHAPARPLAAVLFILFFILAMWEKEAEKFDQEQEQAAHFPAEPKRTAPVSEAQQDTKLAA